MITASPLPTRRYLVRFLPPNHAFMKTDFMRRSSLHILDLSYSRSPLQIGNPFSQDTIRLSRLGVFLIGKFIKGNTTRTVRIVESTEGPTVVPGRHEPHFDHDRWPINW